MSVRHFRSLVVSAAAGLALAGLSAGGDPKDPSVFRSVRLKPAAERLADPRQMAGAVLRQAHGPWKPRVDREVGRGSEELYAKVAPAVVVVRTASGHGTGFLVDPDGWVVTNHHVIAHAQLDPRTGARQATVYLGRLKGGVMELDGRGVPALVYKASEEKDLALLKLTLPKGAKPLPVIRLAKSRPLPGADCVGVGHPRAGLLWSVRTGTVTGVGRWPEQLSQVVVARLGLKEDADRKRLAALFKKSPQVMRVVLSSCGMNPGDSGGPLVNKGGELIGVTFAVPASEGPTRVDKFTYHVHVDELAAFLKDRPGEPQVDVPDPWAPALHTGLADLDGDGVPDTLVCTLEPGGRPTGLLFDLKQSSATRYTREQLAAPARGRTWDFQLALHLGPERRAFYDTDGDGKIDLVLIDRDGDGKVDAALRRKGGKWVREDPARYKMIDPSLLPDEASRNRLLKIVNALARRK